MGQRRARDNLLWIGKPTFAARHLFHKQPVFHIL